MLTAYALIFALASVLMFLSSVCFVPAGEPPTSSKSAASSRKFRNFLKDGWGTLRSDQRFRLFPYIQRLAGVTLVALPFYVVAASGLGLKPENVAILLGAQTIGALVSNA